MKCHEFLDKNCLSKYHEFLGQKSLPHEVSCISRIKVLHEVSSLGQTVHHEISWISRIKKNASPSIINFKNKNVPHEVSWISRTTEGLTNYHEFLGQKNVLYELSWISRTKECLKKYYELVYKIIIFSTNNLRQQRTAQFCTYHKILFPHNYKLYKTTKYSRNKNYKSLCRELFLIYWNADALWN